MQKDSLQAKGPEPGSQQTQEPQPDAELERSDPEGTEFPDKEEDPPPSPSLPEVQSQGSSSTPANPVDDETGAVSPGAGKQLRLHHLRLYSNRLVSMNPMSYWSSQVRISMSI